MRIVAAFPLGALIAAGFAGCLEPDPAAPDPGAELRAHVAQLGAPPIPANLPTPVRGLLHVADAEVPTGAGIAVWGHFAYVSALGRGFYVVDIRDPAHPLVRGNVSANESFFARDADLLPFEDRMVVALAGQGTGMHFVNVTDPDAPEVLSSIQLPDRQPTHNLVTLPGTTLVYNAPSTGQGGTNHILDARYPDEPMLVGAFGDHGCHDITVRMDLERAYCAGVQETQIWDISDPVRPKLVVRIDNPFIGVNDIRYPALPPPAFYPVRAYGLHHWAKVNERGNLLMVGDEFNGGGQPGACFAHVRDPSGRSASTPFGALWFFDISDEKNPALRSWFSPTTVAEVAGDPPRPVNCTAHFGDLLPGREQVVVGWYRAGVVLVDFRDPANPYEVTRWNPGTNTWDAKIYHGWVFTGDIARGLDVLKFT